MNNPLEAFGIITKDKTGRNMGLFGGVLDAYPAYSGYCPHCKRDVIKIRNTKGETICKECRQIISRDTSSNNKKIMPYSGNIEKQTLANPNYREALYTSKKSQLVVMNLKPGQSIGKEKHSQDQFFRIEQGQARFDINGKKIVQGNGGAVIVPANTPHNVTNPSKTRELKLYAIYSPSHHPPNTKQLLRPKGD